MALIHGQTSVFDTKVPSAPSQRPGQDGRADQGSHFRQNSSCIGMSGPLSPDAESWMRSGRFSAFIGGSTGSGKTWDPNFPTL
jgi:hypothetical protein